ncbi:hypothetical protein AB5I39_03445 [Sphingomonas sp. MMS24-J45]|uniref:hypothetical protein n=1 Tax=Sphingomonas sp. MMS24-J45 TaxID=3238806 RepID=UPI00384E2931
MKINAQHPPREAGQTTQRVKVGMIGLAAVVLLIGLAAAIFATINHDREVAAIGSARPEVVSAIVSGNSADPAATPTATKEPLAELGVAPSAEIASNTAQPQSRAAHPQR